MKELRYLSRCMFTNVELLGTHALAFFDSDISSRGATS
jgi:hypothetical protein